MLTRAADLERLERLLKQIPGQPLPEFQVTAVERGLLKVQTPTAAAATRLRYRQRELLAVLHRNGHQALKRLEVRVAPVARPSAPPVLAPALGLPEAAAHQLRALASDESDPGLRRALQRLAARSQPD